MPKVSAPQPVADKSGDNIIKIIDAASEAQQSQIKLKTELMRDEILRKRNREDKQLEQQDQMNNWGKMMGGQDQPQGDPVTNNSGIANSATPSQIVSPVGGAMPPGGYTPQQPPPKSMAPQFSQPQAQGAAPVGQPSQGPQGDVITIKGGSGKFMNIQLNGMSPEQAIQNAKQTGQNLGIYNTQEEAQAAMGGQSQPQGQDQASQQQMPIKTQLEEELGFVPKQIPRYIPEMGPNGPRMARNPDYQYGSSDAFNAAVKKNNNGVPLSPGEIKLIKGGIKGYEDVKELSPSLQYRKDKRMEDLLTTIETNKPRKLMVTEAEDAAKRITSGIYGKMQRGWTKNLAPDSPALADYQKIKMVLLDAQLANVAFTKGAISDAEMKLFGEASANDELMSNPRMKVVFNKLNRFMRAQESAKISSYKKIYNEDPREWPELQDGMESYVDNSNTGTGPMDGGDSGNAELQALLAEKARRQGGK